MSESPSKESDIPALSHIGSSVERHNSAVDSVCDARQSRPRLIHSKTGFLTASLPEFSSQGTSIDLQSAFTLLLFTLTHQGIKGLIWVRKLGRRLRSYAC